MNFQELFAKRSHRIKRSSVREILKLTSQPDMISFAGGLPAPELFPVKRVEAATVKIMQERGEAALQYSTSEGMPELRTMIAERMSTDAVTVSPDNVIILNGSQQGLDLICRAFLDDGDKMMVENPSYLGFLMAAKLYDLEYLPISTDENGMRVEELDDLLAQNPKLIYSVPNFQNPQGITLSAERRKILIEKTYNRDLILIEDNPYGELRYSGEAPPHLIHQDAMQRGSNTIEGNVVYIGTFSKVLMPGLRIGWIIAHTDIIDKLVQFKQSTDLHTGTLPQFISYEVAKDGFLDEHIGHLRVAYQKRRDLMLDAMTECFPKGVTWRNPEGGLFLMVYLPEQIDAFELLQKAIVEKVAYVPGADFHIDGTGKNSFRLNYSNAHPDDIVKGVQRLGHLIKAELAD